MIKDHVTAEELKATLRAHLEGFDMSTWGYVGRCGTTCCIAGWALIIAGYEISPDRVYPFSRDERVLKDIPGEAGKLLGIDLDENEEFPLFYRLYWPDHLYDAVTTEGVTSIEVVEIACQAIDYFIPQ